jgi:hypothetical protein
MQPLNGRWPSDELVSIGEAARLSKITRDAFHDLVFRGFIRAKRDTNGNRVVLLSDVMNFKQRLWREFDEVSQ